MIRWLIFFSLLAFCSSLFANGLSLPSLPVSVLDDWNEANTAPKNKSSSAQDESGVQHPVGNPEMPVATTTTSKANHKPQPIPTPEKIDSHLLLSDVTTPKVPIKRSQPKISDDEIAALEKRWVQVTPGIVEVQKISLGHLNRIEVPFEHPQVRTISDADIQVSGRILYVTAKSDKVISLYITTPDESVAISLGLLPQRIPPRDFKLTLMPVEAQVPTGFALHSPNPMAKKTEQAQPYVRSLRAIVTSIAKGEVPSGYTFQKAKASDLLSLHHCTLPGLSISMRQRLDGHAFIVSVSEVTNMSTDTIELDESLCYRQGVVAVAAWPEVILLPGQKTELYIVHRREVFTPQYKGNARPSVLGGGY